jgi:hypothetical protein
MSNLRLVKSVQSLIEFLRPTGSEFWVRKLSEIALGLRSAEGAQRAAADLENMFGGMGSLNDLYFCDTNKNLPAGEDEKGFNKRFAQLMDQTFKELRLHDAGLFTRLHWSYLAWKHRNELAPRIKKTFRRSKSA